MIKTLILILNTLAQPFQKANRFDSPPESINYLKDSDVILLKESFKIYYSNDKGQTFNRIKDIPENPNALIIHPFDAKTAFVLSGTNHWFTRDSGKNWNKFTTPHPVASGDQVLEFHSKQPEKILIQLNDCGGADCKDDYYYTDDWFKNTKLLIPWTSQCVWAQNISPELDLKEKIFCIQWPEKLRKGDVSWKDASDLTLVTSSNLFKSQEEIFVGGGVPVLGLIPHWLIGVVKNANGGYQLVTCKDGVSFTKSTFISLKGEQNDQQRTLSFTILESTKTTLFVDVVSSSTKGSKRALPFGTMYISTSDGRYFSAVLEHTNRDLSLGLVDVEHIQSNLYEGVLLANTVKNWQAIADHTTSVKELSSWISFDSGRRWSTLQPPAKDSRGKDYGCTPVGLNDSNCSLHLHSVTTSKNVGKVFSVSSSPGTIVGVGNVGPNLHPYEESDTFISNDSGLSWTEVQKGPHKYEVLDFGSTIALIPDGNQKSSYILYSKNRGKDWEKFEFTVDGGNWVPYYTAIDSESTMRSMLLVVSKDSSFGDKYAVHLNFDSIFSRKCNSDLSTSNQDLELWELESLNGRCVLGRRVAHYRRKADANCYIDSKFSPKPVSSESCKCTEFDYECDTGYIPVLDSKSFKCVAKEPLDQPLDCKKGTQYLGSSGYKLLDGNQCKGGDDKKAEKVNKDCQDKAGSKPKSDPITRKTTFKDHIIQLVQIPASPISLVLTKQGEVWRSSDHGGTWNQVSVPESEPVLNILLHDNVPNRVFLFTKEKVYVSEKGLEDKLALMKTPEPFNAFGISIFDFHPTEQDWYVYIAGGRNCGSGSNVCHSVVYITKDAGKTFEKVEEWATKCQWAQDVEFIVGSIQKDAIFCSSFRVKNGNIGQDKLESSLQNPVELVMILGKSKSVLRDMNVLDFYVVKNILLVATNQASNPVLYSSIDGQKFENVQFPPDINLKESNLEIIPSNTGVFLHVSKNHGESAAVFKSNYDGRFFSKILDSSNTNIGGSADFAKFPGLDGVAVGNVKKSPLGSKRVESRISFNDGLSWQKLKAPLLDSTGEPSACDGDCSLHIHLQSEGIDEGMLLPFGTAGSAGLMVALGNLGTQLVEVGLSNVYLTRDAGKSWREIKKGSHKWAIADYGGLLVLVSDQKPTSSLSYSWDFGLSWADYTFSKDPIKIESIVAHEGANKILISGHLSDDSIFDSEVSTISIHVDFSELFTRNCDRKKIGGGSSDDFETWSPLNDSGCYFGQKTNFIRRKSESVCSIGPGFVALQPGSSACECSEMDFECDQNYFRTAAGTCDLFGVDPEQPANCAAGKTYKGSSGYRKIPQTKCSGGKDWSRPVERECGTGPKGPEHVKIDTYIFSSFVDDFFYFKNTGKILVKDIQHNAYLSENEGANWKKILNPSGEKLAIFDDESFPNRGFVVMDDGEIWVTNDQGNIFKKIETDGVPDGSLAPQFLVPHPLEEEWLLWIGAKDCEVTSDHCHTSAQVSWNYGKNWEKLIDYAYKCTWGHTAEFNLAESKTIFCAVFEPQSGNQRSLMNLKLKRSDDGSSKFTDLLPVAGFTVLDEYLVAAVPNAETKQIQMQVSLDGKQFSLAEFGGNTITREGYTLLDSSTGNIFLHVVQSVVPSAEYGSLFKSSWNGTRFGKSLDFVNQNRNGFVDFEKLNGVNGTMIANQVSNANTVSRYDPKKLITKISFDDGETWTRLKAPEVDSEGKSYNCASDCYLNLHAFTERHDKTDQFSFKGVSGYLIGVGNVGSTLTDFDRSDTFMSVDAGRIWKEIAKEANMYEIADHGGVIVLFNDEKSSNVVKYSLNGGASFRELKIDQDLDGGSFRIQNILTEPSGTSSHVVLIGILRSSKSETSAAIHLDFSNVWSRICKDDQDPSKSDFELWPSSAESLSCTFGAKVQHKRRKAERECVVGQSYKPFTPVITPCSCDYADYECDTNYVRDGLKCVLASGALKPQPKCVNGDMKTSTGYVKRKISRCTAGLNLDFDPNTYPCSNQPLILDSGVTFSKVLFSGFALVTVLGLVYMCTSFYAKQSGRIALPLDGPRFGDTETTFARVVKQTVALIGMGVMTIVNVGTDLVDYVRNKIRGRQGYEPVSTYYDPTIGNNAATL